ncbi:hypothetical protein [Vampirovibrio chlorellavorus]|uniref:hypothetical protein n=1 Tax=Vampirovibrio chlorellavorus TaxID=758823 RepID=UPI0026F117FE|nr:hypothetical protein [Vampirovibrio chlorellavorus]
MPNLPKTPQALGLTLALALALLTTCAPPSQADVMHFMNGKLVQGKLDRVTGDLIEFREDSNFGSKMNIHRIQLTNRHDVVEVNRKKRYFGEIVYLDKFKLDLKTATGMVKLNRLRIRNVVIGSPADQPVSNLDVMPLAPQNGAPGMGGAPALHSAPLTGTGQNPGVWPKPEAWEDQDAIPAVSH